MTIKMLLALREATGNALASDAFMQALEEREACQREALKEIRERGTQREARIDKIHQNNLNFMHSNLDVMRSEIKTTQRWITWIVNGACRFNKSDCVNRKCALNYCKGFHS